MNPIEAEAAAALHLAQQAEHWAGRWFRHYETSAAQAAATATIETNPREEPVSLLGEAKTIGHDLIEKLENIDEAALGAVEAIKVNPTGVSIVNTLASIAHLPDPQGLLGTVDATLKAFAPVLVAAAQATAAQQGTQAAGVVTGGQA